MTLYVCDRCCKQINRFVPNWECKYDIRRSAHGEKASWLRSLYLCEDCQKHIDDLLDKDFALVFKEKVTIDTGVEWR